MESLKNYSVQDISIEGEYKEYLHRQLFDVNVRLYKSSKPYKLIVDRIIEYMKDMFSKKFHDYGSIKGISGANLAIPFNIVVLKRRSNGKLSVLINPEIVEQTGKQRVVSSNCGSLMLDEPIEVSRRSKIKVAYYKPENKRLRYRIGYFEGSEACTIQHEVDHNNGITILDRRKNDLEFEPMWLRFGFSY